MAKSAPAPSDLADKFMLRLPPGLKDRLAAAAKETGRSINQEIVTRLELSLDSFSSIEGIASDVEELKKFADRYGPFINSLWWAVENIERDVEDIYFSLSPRLKQIEHPTLKDGDFDQKAAEEQFAREFPKLRRRSKDPSEPID